MLDKPEDSSLESMLLPGTGANDSALLRRIIRAWEKVETVNKLKHKEGIGNETYSQWVAERVQEVKLPFIPKVPVVPPALEPALVSLEEMARLHRAIADLEIRKGELTDGLLKAVQDKSKLEQEAKEKDIAIEDLKDHLAAMKNGKIQVDEALFGANCELSHRNERIRSLERELKVLRGFSTEVARLEAKIEEDRRYAKMTFRTQKEGFIKKTKELEKMLAEEKEKLNDMAEHYESRLSKQGEKFEALFRLKEEHWKRELAKNNFALNEEKLKIKDLRRDLKHVHAQAETLHKDRLEWIDRFRDLKEETQMLLHDRDAWRNRFHALASLTNASIDLFWDKLKKANALVSLTQMPQEVQQFVVFCAQKVKEFREKIKSEM